MNSRLRLTPPKQRLAQRSGNAMKPMGLPVELKIFDPSGKAIGFIALPERSANVCFGGVKRNRLFMAASHSVYSLYVNTQGAPGG